MMTDFLNEVGTTEVARDSLKMEVNKPASWSAHDLRKRLYMTHNFCYI